MAETGSGGGETRPDEVAAYIAAMSAEMGRLARKHKLPALGYLLELARMEALEQCEAARRDGGKRIA